MIYKTLMLFLLAVGISGCTTFFSGGISEPIGQDDRTTVMNARAQLFSTPHITDQISDRKVKILVFVFDGTENDRDQFDQKVERNTVAALLGQRLTENGYPVHYINGPGVDSKMDAAICLTCIPKAEEALGFLKKSIESYRAEFGDTEFRILVIGFSRGAAIGRHFMNLVSDTWPSLGVLNQSNSGAIVRTFGVLFDTVATGKTDQLRLGISPTTDYLIHVVARDERRPLFPVVLDVDKDFPPIFIKDGTSSRRYVQMTLPGVHSDIGGSYLDGLSSAYRIFAEQILVELNLYQVAEWTLENGMFDRGAHDSRGYFDTAFGVKSALEKPTGIRKNLLVSSIPLSQEERDEINSRITAYQYAKVQQPIALGSAVNWGSSSSTAKFKAIKSEDRLQIIPESLWIRPDTVSFKVNAQERILEFGALGMDGKLAMSHIRISDKLWAAFAENATSIFEIVIKKTVNQDQIHFLVDGQKIEVLNSGI